jgi:FkbM family methyltransferase
MHTDFFLDQSAIVVREHRVEFSYFGRNEKRIRRLLLRQPNPDCSLVKAACGIPRPVAGLGRLTIQTPGKVRTLYFRPGTSDTAVILDTFQKWQYSLKRLPHWPEILSFLKRCDQEGRRPLIIDAGANIGASAAFFALSFPTATVIAIEPEDSNFDLLCKNTIGLNVICVKAALSCDAGQVKLVDPGDGPWAYRTSRVGSGDGPPCTTVDALYGANVSESTFPFVVKIDIEGGEEDVFGRNIAWVDDTPIVVIELHDWMLPGKGSALPFLRCVSASERDFIYFGENVFSIDGHFLNGAAKESIVSMNGL